VINFYYNCDYLNLMASLGVGRYTAAALKLLQFIPYTFANNLRSLTIPPGYIVTLYSSDNFLGQSYDFTTSVPCLNSFNDKTQSLIITTGGLLLCSLQSTTFSHLDLALSAVLVGQEVPCYIIHLNLLQCYKFATNLLQWCLHGLTYKTVRVLVPGAGIALQYVLLYISAPCTHVRTHACLDAFLHARTHAPTHCGEIGAFGH
jgi:hypothetical protein